MLLSNVQAVVMEHPQPYKKMGEHGYVCPWVEKEYGGPGMRRFRERDALSSKIKKNEDIKEFY